MTDKKLYRDSPTVIALTLVLAALLVSALSVAAYWFILFMLPVVIVLIWLIYQFARFLVSTGRFRRLPFKAAILMALLLTPVAAYAPFALSLLEMRVRASMVGYPLALMELPNTFEEHSVLTIRVDPFGSSSAGPAVIYNVQDRDGKTSEISVNMVPYSPYFVFASAFWYLGTGCQRGNSQCS